MDQYRRPRRLHRHPLRPGPYFDGIDTDLTTPIGVFDTHKVTGYLACTTTTLATLLGR